MKVPVSFEILPNQLQVKWNDGLSTQHSLARLRKECPCATCRTERQKLDSPKGLTSLRVIQTDQVVKQAELLEVIPVGRYALSFKWNDGHHTGIYAYEFLLSLADPH
jgi:DUF971 family protein